jgi:hypothetical protein
MIKCFAVAAALVMSSGFVLAQSAQTETSVAPSAAHGTLPTPQNSKPRLDGEGYNMDKAAPSETMGPVKKNPDPSAASTPDMSDAANPTATTGEAQKIR